MKVFTQEVCQKLGYYVYLYLDPTSGEIFYVGKGTGNRAFSHLEDDSESEKSERIRTIRNSGREPRIELLAHGLDEKAAYQLEASTIDLLNKKKLTNTICGWHSGIYGRMTIEQIQALYGADDVEIKHPCILIRINELFRYGLTPMELYDATRGVWRIGHRRENAKFALAVFDGVVQEVYEIQGWFPAGPTMSTSTRDDTTDPHRWEFVGRIAPQRIRSRYRYKSVRNHFPRGAQNPIRYINLDGS